MRTMSTDYNIKYFSGDGDVPIENIMEACKPKWTAKIPQGELKLNVTFFPAIISKMVLKIYGIESISVTGKYIDKNGQEKYNRVYVNRSVIQLADLTPKIENIDIETSEYDCHYLTEFMILFANPDYIENPKLMEIISLRLLKIRNPKQKDQFAYSKAKFSPLTTNLLQGSFYEPRNDFVQPEGKRVGGKKKKEMFIPTVQPRSYIRAKGAKGSTGLPNQVRTRSKLQEEEEEIQRAMQLSKNEFDTKNAYLGDGAWATDNNSEIDLAIRESINLEEEKVQKENSRADNVTQRYNLRNKKFSGGGLAESEENDETYQNNLMDAMEESRKENLRQSGYAYLGKEKKEETKKATGPGQRVKRTDCHEGHLCEYLLWDYVIYLHGFKEGTKRENFLKKRMEDLVPYMGGFISLKITNEVTHIIVKDLDAAKEILQSPNGDISLGKPVIDGLWMQNMHKRHRKLDYNNYLVQ